MSSQEDLSKNATKELVNLVLERGYFHNDVLPIVASPELRQAPNLFSEKDDGCILVSTKDGTYMTRQRLSVRLQEELAMRGRMSIEDLALILAVDKMHIERALQETSMSGSFIRIENDLITNQYLDELCSRLDFSDDGSVAVSQVAQDWDMPPDAALHALEERVERGIICGKIVSLAVGGKTLVSPRYEERLRCRIRGAFRAITLPTQVESVCYDFEWDLVYILPILQDLCTAGEVQGEVHQSEASLTGAMFIPNVYIMMQRASVDEFFAANGFITTQDCLERGVLQSQMGDYVQETNPTAVVLSNSVIMKDMVVTPLEPVLEEAIANDTFLDLRLHLPESLMLHEEDVKIIVQEMALSSDKLEGMCTVFSNGEALFVSHGMTRHIFQTLLPPLIESFAKSRAEELLSSSPSPVEATEETTVTTGKKHSSKRKSKKAAKHKAAHSKESMQYGVVPLVTVAKIVAKEYPDLSDIQGTVGPLVEVGAENAPVWESTEDDGSGGPLYQVCRSVVYGDDFQSLCERAVKAEVERLESVRMSVSVRDRKEGAAKVRSIEGAFEDAACFNASCYSVQLFAKFLQYVSSLPDVSEDDLSLLREDFLNGVCADFTSRITQYCLFRNEVEDGVFFIERDTSEAQGETVESSLSEYCQPVDCALRYYPSTKLNCSDESDGKPRLPLPTLRQILPGSVGVSLARTWTLCGGKCFEGGTRVNDDGTESVRRGDADGLLSHVEESCLTICGLPFKKLDKKAEKQYLFVRRKALTEALEAANDGRGVLELTIMLLFQQVKNLVVSGPHLTGIILALLEKEKKVPPQVSKLLKDLAAADSNPGASLVAAVKSCGLSRDISRHTIE